jgi:hypothetical protein
MTKEKKVTGDFSRSVIKKEVVKKAATHPLTLFPLAAGLGGVFATVLFGSPILLVASAALTAASAGSFFVNAFVRGKTIADRYLKAQQELMDQQKMKDLPRIRQDLVNCQAIPVAREVAIRAIRQFDQLEKTMANIHKLLNTTMKNYEVALWRIDIATDELFLKVFANLKAILGIFISIESIDLDHINTELARIRKIKKPSENDLSIKETLQERKKLLEDQLQKAESYLAINAQCITQMEALTTSIAGIDASNEDDIDAAVLELQSLSAMAASLANNSPEIEIQVNVKRKDRQRN